MQAVYTAAENSGLFARNDVKVRLRSFTDYRLGDGKEDFLHVFAYIMEGRTTEQKAALSKAVVESLNNLLPSLSILSMNVMDFEKSTYCNKALIHPDNKGGDRHFELGV